MQVTFCRTDGNGLFLFVISDFYACQTDDAFVSQLCFLEQQVFYRRFVFELALEEGFGQKSFKQFEQLVFLPGGRPIVNRFTVLSEIPASSPESDALSKDMKKRGFKFFGSTICYAFLQATGFVDDHLEGCFCKK